MQEVAAFRGSVLRAYLDSVRAEGEFDRVRAIVDDEARGAMDLPPTSSEFVPSRITNALIEGYHILRGADATRALARRANRAGIVRIIEPVIRTAMRIGGASPAAILSRLELILRQQQRGYELGWEELDARSGRVRVVSHGLRETPAAAVSWEGALSIAFDLTQTDGTLRMESQKHVNGASTTTFLARW